MKIAPNSVRRNAGSILPLVLVMTVVLSAVVVALASYVSAGLRYSTVVEDRADRLAAADGGLRYGIERLSLQQYAGCFTALGNAGYNIPFPAVVNESQVTVTCRKAGTGFGDVQGWAIIATGEGVPPGPDWYLHSQGGAGQLKLLGGPVYVADPSRITFTVPVKIEDGDLWYSDTPANCKNAENAPPGVPTNLTFKPALRGMLCLEEAWNVLYTAPLVTVPTVPPVTIPTVDASGCKVWSPGMYTGATFPALGSDNYFKAGEYYFESVNFVVDKNVVAGWASTKYGDQQFVANPKCANAVTADANSPGSAPGATFYLGGTSNIYISGGRLEILRRKQGTSLVSIQALDSDGPGYIKSSLIWNQDILSTKSGLSGGQDMVVHGLVWAPKAQLTFGNVTNVANGQLLGGAAFARIDLQSSASASGFIIRIESDPIPVTVILDAKATKNGRSTTMRAIVQISDNGMYTAINSWRVLDPN